jgi:hypothetical protein
MFKQLEYTYNSTLATPTSDWWPIVVAGYEDIAVQIISNEGWDGEISFWGGTRTSPSNAGALWALNDAEDNSLTDVVYSVVGATPNYTAKNYRGSVAGLNVFGVYFAHPTTYQPASGIIKVYIGLNSSAK